MVEPPAGGVGVEVTGADEQQLERPRVQAGCLGDGEGVAPRVGAPAWRGVVRGGDGGDGGRDRGVHRGLLVRGVIAPSIPRGTGTAPSGITRTGAAGGARAPGGGVGVGPG